MRVFTNDSPEFFCFQLEGSDTVYKIPLAASMPFPNVLLVKEGVEGYYKMLKIYIGDDADKLTTGQISEITRAWSDASHRSGAKPGESSALSD